MIANLETVVTAIGIVGSFGTGEEALLKALQGEIPCIGTCTLFDSPHKVAEVTDFRLSNHIKNPRAERSPRLSQFALAAAAQALAQAGIDSKVVGSEDTAIVYGTSNGPAVATERSLESIYKHGLGAVEPLIFQESVFNAPASLISIQFGIKGPAVVVPMGWTAGMYALKQGCDLLRSGHAERVIVIAADELAGETHQALDRLGFVTPNDAGKEAMRPYGESVNGAIIGEGAVALVLEPAHAAKARNARIRAHIRGCAIGGDALGPSAPDTTGQAMKRVITLALERANRTASDIDHVLAGTTSTAESDLAELNGLAELAEQRNLPWVLTSIKPYIGETMGPAGLINLVAGILELERSEIFGNKHECKGSQSITFPTTTGPANVRTVLVNAVGVSGTYASTVIEATP